MGNGRNKKGQFTKDNIGRPEGSKNKRTVEWEALGKAITGMHTERFNSLLLELPDDKFMDKYLQILEYFKPKQLRTEVKDDSDRTIIVKLPDDSRPD